MQAKLFLKISRSFKKNKKHNAQTDRQKSKLTMILKPNNDNGLEVSTRKHQLPAAVAVAQLPTKKQPNQKQKNSNSKISNLPSEIKINIYTQN